MMREAAKMQQDPAFQARMNQVMANPQFQEHMDKQKEVLKDEAKVKDLEESMKGRIEEGNKELEEFKKRSAELEAQEEAAKAEGGMQTAAGVVPKKKNQKPKTSSKKKGKKNRK